MQDIVNRLRLQFDSDTMRPTQPVTVECVELELACSEIERLRRSASGWEADAKREAENAAYWKLKYNDLARQHDDMIRRMVLQ